MRFFTAICITLIIAGFFSFSAEAQTPAAAKIKPLGVSPNLVALKIPGIDRVSNGLSNVGIGTKVYLYCGGKPSTGATGTPNGTHFKSATFTLLSKPTGSTSALAILDSIRVSFSPDVKGQYTISMVGTDDQNKSDSDTLVVSAGTYVGNGVYAATPVVPNCVICHASKANDWKGTNHATAFQRKIDDGTGHFASYCISCHANGSTDPTSPSGGFLDLMKTSAWKFPTVLKAGNYDSLKLVDPKLAAFVSIQCENCHGPGSEHQFKKNDPGMVYRLTSDQCNQCHDAPPYHTKVAEYENSAHANSLNEGEQREYMNRGSKTAIYSDCARCHTSNGYLDVFIDGGPDPTKAFSNAPYADAGYVGCVTCHDPHSKKNDFQLRKPVGEICLDCHNIRPSGQSGLHSSHQGPMLKGVGGREIPGYVYYNSAHSEIEERCAQCHMANPTLDSTHSYLKNKIGGHSFKVFTDNGTADPADDYLNTAGCVGCHPANIALVDGVQEQVKMLLDTLKSILPKKTDGTGRPLFPYGADTTKLNDVQKIAAWNYYFVLNDGSFGVHNKNYAWTLLQASIKALRSTAVEKIDAPGAFNLAQNYPNPFNPSTTIEFSIPAASNVRLAIYDATGKELMVLVNGYMEGGTYRVRWNGNTNGDQAAPSGMYFYRIAAGSSVSTRKMLLVK